MFKNHFKKKNFECQHYEDTFYKIKYDLKGHTWSYKTTYIEERLCNINVTIYELSRHSILITSLQAKTPTHISTSKTNLYMDLSALLLCQILVNMRLIQIQGMYIVYIKIYIYVTYLELS